MTMSPGLSAEDLRDQRQPRWLLFDSEWYQKRYPDVAAWMAEKGYDNPELFYREVGCFYGHSPNRYFDEAWYRETYADVRRALIDQTWSSGFEHYCAEGYKKYSPHWLFDEVFYRRRALSLTEGYFQQKGLWNGYDHYLEVGERCGFRAGPFVDTRLCREMAQRFPDYFGEEGLLASWLVLPAYIADSAPISWYFDPVWYQQAYPQVKQDIENGRYTNTLHHYVTNETPRKYNPSFFFDEGYYLEHSPDIGPTLDAGKFRNGYEHFVCFGASEKRAPVEGVDLVAYYRNVQVRSQCESGLYDNAFTRFVAERCGHASMTGAEAPCIEENQSRVLFQREADALLASIARSPLDFTTYGMPEVSVIMVVHDQIALTLQALLSLRANYSGSIQLIIVNSGSLDETSQLRRFVHGADILTYRFNIGYLEGCNAALSYVKAPSILYLNNDLRLYPDALSHALRRLYQNKTTGAVAAKLVRSNLYLQEAGSIIWRDGATYGYRRQDNPNIPEVNFVREVDYGSAAFLLVRSGLVRRLAGYDERYCPAYFEDTDLCVRLDKLGARIVYDPSVVVEHLEFGSSGHKGSYHLIQKHWRIFAQQHQDFLRFQQPPHVCNALLGRERRHLHRKRVLFIEDRMPLRGLGSGYVRSNDIIRVMVDLGYHVTVYPVLDVQEEVFLLYREFPENVELAYGQNMTTLADFLEERAGYYDLLWIGRTHNMTRLLPILSKASRFLFRCSAVLDTEVVAAPRTLLQRRIVDKVEPRRSLDKLLKEELQSAHYCQHIIAVTAQDAALIKRAGYSNVAVLGHSMTVNPTPRSFEERRDILFLGAMHDETSPNYDSMMWFTQKVMPYLEDLPDKAVLRIVGYVPPAVDLTPLACHPRVEIVGAVDDLAPFFDQHRVFVAPTRFAGGLPFKVHQAAAYGLPIVATTLLREQTGWGNGEILSESIDNPEIFADAVRRLYNDKTLWHHLRTKALLAVEKELDPAIFKKKLAEIMVSSLA